MNRNRVDEDLRKWFDPKHPEGGWKRVNTKGEVVGPCAREPGEAKPKCMSNEKRRRLSKTERAAAVRTKRTHDPDPERKGEPIMVSNFGKGKISDEYVIDPKDSLVESMDLLLEKNKPTSPDKWADCISQAKAKFDVYPSAYANGWAAQCYKRKGGKWKSIKESRRTFADFCSTQQILDEVAPPSESIKKWTEEPNVKKSFKQQYGSDWENVLYGKAWKMYKKGKLKEALEEPSNGEIILEKHIVQSNLVQGMSGEKMYSLAKKLGGRVKSQRETTEFTFDDPSAAKQFMKATTGKGLNESECDSRPAGKPWRTPGSKKKFAVCVDNKLIRFGDPGLSIKRDQPGRLKNFRARHGCDKSPARDTPKYWSCQMWRKDKSVGDVIKSGGE
jgi:hypothetical protein